MTISTGIRFKSQCEPLLDDVKLIFGVETLTNTFRYRAIEIVIVVTDRLVNV